MSQKIASIGITKYQAVPADNGNAVRHEYEVWYTVKDMCETPSKKMATCTGIEKAIEESLLLFKVHFDNGETWHLYPTPPFDIGYFTLKEEE